MVVRKRSSQSRRAAKRHKSVAAPSGCAHGLECSYRGWDDQDQGVSCVSLKGLQPEAFWANFISRRRPVILTDSRTCKSFEALSQWTLEHLKSRAGEASVQVEWRSGCKDSFGKGKRQQMPFRSFVDRLEAHNNQNLYVTTQAGSDGNDSQIAILQPPLCFVSDEIVLKPDIMGNLVLQSCNLWVGSSNTGAASGLHHDFHDNLYVLLKGRKKFQLWSPAQAAHMYTYGKIQKVHSNGRIVYEGEGNVHADGSCSDDRLADSQLHASRKLQAAQECRLADGASGFSDDSSEAALEAALDGALAAGNNIPSRDDYQDSDEELCSTTRAVSDDGQVQEPDSFSQIDLTQSAESTAAKYPLFPGLSKALTCTLNAGDLLYLPAGWFHNVVSSNSMSAQADSGRNYHMALNYWFHPPDNLDSSAEGFARPYSHAFWPDRWRQHIDNLDQKAALKQDKPGRTS